MANVAGQGIPKGSKEKCNPGDAPGGMSNKKCEVNIPSDKVPSSAGQSSGKVKHGRDKFQGKVENLNNFPTSNQGKGQSK